MITVGEGAEALTYRVDAAEWAGYLNRAYERAPRDDGYTLPTADHLVDGLPQFAADDLMDVSGGEGGDVIALAGDHWVWADHAEEEW